MKIKWSFALILIALLLAAGCSGAGEQKDGQMEDFILEQNEKMQALEQKIDELSRQNEELLELLAEKTLYDDLLVLTAYEQLIFGQFKEAHDDSILEGLGPVSVCKMYLYAGLLRDYGTEYELYTREEGYVLTPKEEYLSIRDRRKDFSIFQQVYDLKIEFDSTADPKDVQISWKSCNGYVDDKQGAFTYTFCLRKENGSVWKVCFLPMQ